MAEKRIVWSAPPRGQTVGGPVLAARAAIVRVRELLEQGMLRPEQVDGPLANHLPDADELPYMQVRRMLSSVVTVAEVLSDTPVETLIPDGLSVVNRRRRPGG